ncbi:HRDC domain-containing protein [Paenibacillus sp. GSMTC-2017]|uniref:HRDC domain-containing protein n=1 Tax=Paenibacillus sp. GSMTC-2017 TaxID=2794350 RepID=UPI0018D74ED7|nr:HRDC domain-containing protein [Paenibacillus sp. GSMTC-2017]MBH5317276.1 HRDC domain-containing protein [Paenibacillus sp. GSMTC-2017]
MQIVFLNTFEKPSEGNGVISAQLSICEEQGLWSVNWLEESELGQGEDSANSWFEGTSWEEMITAFRHGVAKVMGQGYTPIIESLLENGRSSGGSLVTMLQCYGELNSDPELFELLREWRRKTASAEKKSAYLVTTNRMLWMISAFVPQTEGELKLLPGWGQTKHDTYGSSILEITSQKERDTVFPLDWVSDKLDTEVYTAWLYKQKENKYKDLMDKQQEKKRILTLLQQSSTLDQIQSELSIPRRELLLRIEQLEQEGYNIEPLIEQELITVPESEQQLIWDALTKVGDRYLKPVLLQVYGENVDNSRERPVELLYEKLRLMRMRYRRNGQGKAV